MTIGIFQKRDRVLLGILLRYLGDIEDPLACTTSIGVQSGLGNWAAAIIKPTL